MGQPKGSTGNPNGRPKGAVNKVTMEVKQAFKNLLEMNTPNMIEWMERVAATEPAKALSLCADLAEFIVPKLARTELTGKDGDAIEHKDVSRSDAQILADFLSNNKKGNK